MSDTPEALGLMLSMRSASGEEFALKFEPGHQQHGWIFYDNHGTWVTLRPALPHELSRAQAIVEFEKRHTPCKP